MSQSIWALGLMSGTSLDGIDAALVRTDGVRVEEFGPALSVPYSMERRDALRRTVLGDIARIEHDLTLAHIEAVEQLLSEANMKPGEVGVIGFHGQTIAHRPAEGITWQIGNGALLADRTGIDVVFDFRRRDVAAGGQGAPLVPFFHAALVKEFPRPIAVVNIGGLGNVSWVGENAQREKNILAFDTGTGNGLLDDWVRQHTGELYDRDGQYGCAGKIDEERLARMLSIPFFSEKPPKSLDREDFTLEIVEGLSLEDGAATLAALTAEGIIRAESFFPEPVARWCIAGGGRYNQAIMNYLKARLPEVLTAEECGWDGDALEAQAFGYLAVRSLRGLPLTLPSTTGVKQAVTGGAFYRAAPDGALPHPASAR